jgi:hypothetical protein
MEKFFKLIVITLMTSCIHEFTSYELDAIKQVKILHFSHLKDVMKAKCQKVGKIKFNNDRYTSLLGGNEDAIDFLKLKASNKNGNIVLSNLKVINRVVKGITFSCPSIFFKGVVDESEYAEYQRTQNNILDMNKGSSLHDHKHQWIHSPFMKNDSILHDHNNQWNPSPLK